MLLIVFLFFLLQIIKKISLPHWATCFSLSSKSQLIAVGSKGKVWVNHQSVLKSCLPWNAIFFSMDFLITPVKKILHVFLTMFDVLSERVLKLIKSTSGRFQDFLQHSDSLQTCHFSPSGTLLFTVAYNEILLWEVQGLWGPQLCFWTSNLVGLCLYTCA